MREMIEKGKVFLEKVNIVKNIADLLTKLVSTKKFTWFRIEMGITT